MSDTGFQDREQAVSDGADLLADSMDAILGIGGEEPQETEIVETPDEEKAPETDEKTPADKPEDSADAKDAKTEEAEADEDDYFEIAPEEEGGEPTRLKATDVFEGYQQAETLRAEIAQLKESAPAPTEYTQQLYDTVQARQSLLTELDQVKQFLQPSAPDPRLIDESSHLYDPQQYHAQLVQNQNMEAQLQLLNTQTSEAEQKIQGEQEALQAARATQENAKLREYWPEIKDQKIAEEFKADVVKYFGKYGATAEEVGSIDSALPLIVLKHAVEHLKGQQATAKAVKVVKAKPKLVRGAARNKNPQGGDKSKMYDRLNKSGSIDDAAALLESLL